MPQVSSHPDDQKTNNVGQACAGPGLIQIVALDCLDPEQQQLVGVPCLALAIRHQGRLAWDLKWCPTSHPPALNEASRSGLQLSLFSRTIMSSCTSRFCDATELCCARLSPALLAHRSSSNHLASCMVKVSCFMNVLMLPDQRQATRTTAAPVPLLFD